MAYAALLSLAQILQQTLTRDSSSSPVPNDERQHLESLLENVNSLQLSLEKTSEKPNERIQCLESEIRDAAYAAEDIIENHTTDQNLATVMQKIGSLEKQVMVMRSDDNSQPLPVGSSARPLRGTSTMVGLDKDFKKIKDGLLDETTEGLQIISIVGMGGIGKTTLAQQVYKNEDIKKRFDMLAWVTVSQDYNVREFLLGLLSSANKLPAEMQGASNADLKTHLHKNIVGVRYLIVIDDIWNENVWSQVRSVFPQSKERSRILLTTRQRNVATDANSFLIHPMHTLNKEDAWKLFCQKVCGNNFLPPGFEEDIGRKIVDHCKGHPLAIIVIGGHLSKSPRTKQVWSYVAKNLKSLLISNDEEYSKILSLSYKFLPHGLKGCFLYIGVFPEDFNIPVSMLVNLWVAEGLLKPVESKSLENVGKQCLRDLIERNLVMDSEKNSRGEFKTCKIHDLLRDLCLSEAKEEMFLNVTNKRLDGIPEGTAVRRITMHPKAKNLGSAQGTSVPRSILDFHGHLANPAKAFDFKLLRVLHSGREYYIKFPNEITKVVNLRYLAAKCEWGWSLASIHKLQSLEFLILRPNVTSYQEVFQIPPEIWTMQELRCVVFEGAVRLPDLKIDQEGSIGVLKNLHTLCTVKNFRCTEEVLKRIPNLLKLGIYYENEPKDWGYFFLHNLALLSKLETVKCHFGSPCKSFLQNVKFPDSLTNITLSGCWLLWDDMSVLAALSNLAVLKLKPYAFVGEVWDQTEEQEFRKLKFLLLEETGLEWWVADGTYLPSLEHLLIKDCLFLEEIPFDYIPALRFIELHRCNSSVVTLAKDLQQNKDKLQVQIFGDEF